MTPTPEEQETILRTYFAGSLLMTAGLSAPFPYL
jgi:hypothetical protein